MGRKSREKWERKALRAAGNQAPTVTTQPRAGQDRWERLEGHLPDLAIDDFVYGHAPDVSPEMLASHWSDILAFESRDSGPSLFEGLEKQGVTLPRPEELNEEQCGRKVLQVVVALLKIQVFILGLDHLSPSEAYSLLWNETLWEGCYVQKKTPGAVTIIDASHSLSQSEIRGFIEDLQKVNSVN